MRVRVANVVTHVEAADHDELDWLREALAVKVRKYDPQQGRTVDAALRLYQSKGGRVRFYSGLLPHLRIKALSAGVLIDVLDARPKVPIDDVQLDALREPPWSMTGAREYQYDAVTEALKGGPDRLRYPLHGRGIVWAPTGAGKGHMACALAYAVPGPWVYLVHRGNLASDVAERWDRLTMGLEPRAGFVTRGRWQPSPRFTVATLQTLHANLLKPRFQQLAESAVGIIVDEAHTCPATTFASVIRAFERAYYRIGLSGTPLDRTDQRSAFAVGLLGPVVYRVSASDLADRGVVTLPTVRVVPVWQPPSLSRLDWQDLYAEAVVDSDHRNRAVLACLRHAKEHGNLPSMVFVRHVHHGRTLAAMAARDGLRVQYVHGTSSLHERTQAVARLKSGDLDAVVSTKVFVEGVDVPNLRSVVNAAGGKSVIECLQQAGRSMRVAEGKSAAVVYEIGDKGCHVLHRHAQARLRAYLREGYRYVVDDTIYPERARTADVPLDLGQIVRNKGT